MSSMQAPKLWITPASPVVVDQITRLNTKADTLLDSTQQAVDEMLSLSFSQEDLDPAFQWTQDDLDALLNRLGPLPDTEIDDWLRGLDLSAGDEDFVFNQQLLNRLAERFSGSLDLPPLPEAPEAPTAPADPGAPAEITPPTRPDLPHYSAPDLDFDIPVPQYQDATAEVPFPTLRPITLPEVPDLALDGLEFSATRPVFEGQMPDLADFSFENEVYSPTFMAQIQETVARMLGGGTGLPPDVEYAIYERAREREVELGERDVDQAANEWAAKGHRYPAGPYARRVDRARWEASNKVSQMGREQFIAHWQFQLTQLAAGLQTALAAEEALMRIFSDAETRRFQAAQFRVQMATDIFNAMVAKYNADTSLFQAEATILRERIQAELAKLEVFNAQIRGQQLIGELNAQDVQIFAERLRALQVSAEIFRQRIEAYSAQYEAQRNKIEAFRGQLEANNQLVSIYEADTRAFVEMIRAQQVREERFSTKASIYGKEIDAWKTRYEGLLTGYNAQLERARLLRDVYAADSDRLGQWASAESGRVGALSEKYRAIAAEIGARTDLERTHITAALEIARAAIERYRAAADILSKNAETKIQAGLTAANLLLRAHETATTTFAQLAAGMTSAANVNATIGDSSSASLNYNLSGELEIN